MKKHPSTLLLLIFLLLLNNSFICAQKKWTKGRIVSHQSDTLLGEIPAKNWRITPQKIAFKKAGEIQATTYTATQIKAFYSESTQEWYESYGVTIDKTPIKIEEIKLNPNVQLIEDTVFLKVLVKGLVSLFQLIDDKGKEHFFLQKDGKIQELTFRKYLKKDKLKKHSTLVKNYLQTNRKYQGQLAYLLSDCPKIKNAIEKAPYKMKALQKIMLNYTECTNTMPSFVYQLEQVKLSFYPLIVGGITRLRFFGELSSTPLNELTFKPAWSYGIGIGLLLTLPRTNKKWAIGTELLWRSYTAVLAKEHQYMVGFRAINIEAVEFDLSYLQWNTLIRYQMPQTTWIPYAEIGIGIGATIKKENSLTQTVTFFSTTETETTVALSGFRKIEERLILGIGGIFLKKWNVGIRYEFGTGISNLSKLSSRTQTASLVTQYYF